MTTKNPLQTKVGIIGGGQLGKMMAMEAAKMNIYTAILDPTKGCPAACVANEHIIAGFDNKEAIRRLAEKVDVLTYEFEHISSAALIELEEEGFVIYPSARSLRIIQNKYHQKMELKNHDISLGEFARVHSTNDILKAAEEYGFPMMLKSALGGYDGKGNSLIRNKDEVDESFLELEGNKLPLYVEKYVPFTKEISVLVCRGITGDIKIYPIAENVHKNSILFETCVPADVTATEKEKALSIAKEVANIFDAVGIFCVEMFVTQNGDILLNEVAPRPHNSGHYTIEGCLTSQFENHIRAIVGLPLGATNLIQPTVMRNLLGEDGCEGKSVLEGTVEALSIDGLSLHWYGKEITRPGRKMGHITITSNKLQEVKQKADRASAVVKVIAG